MHSLSYIHVLDRGLCLMLTSRYKINNEVMNSCVLTACLLLKCEDRKLWSFFNQTINSYHDLLHVIQLVSILILMVMLRQELRYL